MSLKLLFMQQLDNVLYIIGNGFDLHHKVNSSYGDFSRWLKIRNRDLYELLNTICEVDYLWSDFEGALPYISRDFLMGAEAFLPTEVDDDTSAADIFLAGDMAKGMGYDLWNDIVKGFRKWVVSIKTPKNFAHYKVMLDYCARFITFNYTTFLETEYGISHDQILYIHGNKSSQKNPPVIGHSGTDTFDSWYDKTHKSNKRFYRGTHSILPENEYLTEGIEEYYDISRKQVQDVIVRNTAYWQGLCDIKHIYVLGHSMAEVDMPYFEQIHSSNSHPENLIWHVSYYKAEEKEPKESQLKKMKVPKTNIDFFKLEEMLLPCNR